MKLSFLLSSALLVSLSSVAIAAPVKAHASEKAQVMLKVRFGEIDRIKANSLRLAGIKSVETLKKYGVFKVYAEPTLIAMSGEKAKFFSGGEMPVHTKAGKVKYESYGIELEFKPQVIGKQIRIDVDYKIKEIDKNKSGQLPHFVKSKSSTSVHLAQGESFMISGIVKENLDIDASHGTTSFMSKIFSPKTNYAQTEMVLSITPYLVEPIKHDEIKLPTDEFNTESEVQKLLGRAVTIAE